jgi:hypothetical protein
MRSSVHARGYSDAELAIGRKSDEQDGRKSDEQDAANLSNR